MVSKIADCGVLERPIPPYGELDTIETRMTYANKVFEYQRHMEANGLEYEPIRLLPLRNDLEECNV